MVIAGLIDRRSIQIMGVMNTMMTIASSIYRIICTCTGLLIIYLNLPSLESEIDEEVNKYQDEHDPNPGDRGGIPNVVVHQSFIE